MFFPRSYPCKLGGIRGRGGPKSVKKELRSRGHQTAKKYKKVALKGGKKRGCEKLGKSREWGFAPHLDVN